MQWQERTRAHQCATSYRLMSSAPSSHQLVLLVSCFPVKSNRKYIGSQEPRRTQLSNTLNLSLVRSVIQLWSSTHPALSLPMCCWSHSSTVVPPSV
ncbi:hypothetical protein GQ54DRAFT_321981 [Martensiomyces pterosporus]|nr:hypothetical protein GQ54DRAFT_321981 [Martensiomyces pterosporus]